MSRQNNNRKKSIACFVLVGVMITRISISAFAGSGTQYGYSNFKITWSVTDKLATATAISGTSATIDVSVKGNVYDASGRLVGSFGDNKTCYNDNHITASAPKIGGTVKNGYAEGYRHSDGQRISTSIA